MVASEFHLLHQDMECYLQKLSLSLQKVYMDRDRQDVNDLKSRLHDNSTLQLFLAVSYYLETMFKAQTLLVHCFSLA